MPDVSRRQLLGLAAGTLAGGAFSARIATLPAAAAGPNPARPLRQFRAMWLTTVGNSDWPSRTGLSAAQQRAEYVAWLDLARKLHLNAVFCQVRPNADAFWPSPYEPWSRYLTGVQGRDPGYDPLAFMVTEAHRRNLEFHAWFNPYRVSKTTALSSLSSHHPARRHPEWTFTYGSARYYNPGLPHVRRFVEDAMLDAVQRYDIDGVHFDDYFYPYPIAGKKVPDAAAYAAYGRGIRTLGDWRRDNVNLLVLEMNERIHRAKPWVKFGISPFGIWRNQSSDRRGSRTGGLESYDDIYADTRYWVKKGWVDYINPQIYWKIGLAVADYAKLVPWWNDVCAGTDVALYVGQALYKETPGGYSSHEMSRHLTLNRAYREVDGDVFFTAGDVRRDPIGAMAEVVKTHYSRPALVPVIAHLGGEAPATPTAVTARRTSRGVEVRWHASSTHRATSYAVWRFAGNVRPTAADFADATHLVTTLRGASGRDQSYVDQAARGPQTYVVTAYDRRWHQSGRSAAARVG